MKKVFLNYFLFCLLLASYTSTAQVGINTTNPHPSAALDITAVDKGLLLPRITTAARLGMTGMANSLLVFDTDLQLFFYYQAANAKWYSLNAWQSEVTQTGGNTDTITTTYSSVGIGTSVPTKRLDVVGDIGATATITAGHSITAPKIYGEGTMPAGAIIMWSGAITAIPAGWALCDGDIAGIHAPQIIPNLSGRFVVGYDSADVRYNNLSSTNRIGGNDTITIQNNNLPIVSPWSINDPGHIHDFKDRSGYTASLSTGNDSNNKNESQLDADRKTFSSYTGITLKINQGGGQGVDIRPPYYVVAYIIKLNY